MIFQVELKLFFNSLIYSVYIMMLDRYDYHVMICVIFNVLELFFEVYVERCACQFCSFVSYHIVI